jgi:hypothetical protein
MKTLPLAAALLLACPVPAMAQKAAGKLPPYAESIRCAGLAEAAANLEPGGPAANRGAAFDAAIFWGMAASEAARKDGLSGERFTADQVEAAAKAERELRAPGTDALTELALCIARVPPLPRKGERG